MYMEVYMVVAVVAVAVKPFFISKTPFENYRLVEVYHFLPILSIGGCKNMYFSSDFTKCKSL